MSLRTPPRHLPAARGRHARRVPPVSLGGELWIGEQEVALGRGDDAGYGAYRVADVRRTQGGRAWAHAVLNKAWRDGCRNPQMTEMLASMVVVDGLVDGVEPTDPKAPVAAALSYIVECRTTYSSQHGQIFDRLAKRERRLAALMDAPERPQRDPAKAVNRRQPHATLLAEPLANAAVPVKKARPKQGAR